ncbi:angiotensin-converting enzyme 2-like isoform X2 [Convolutriloba macropyga]|uniref:angiotensin-converting enzyme 2-like isoform X2 n=1 Tax=Convolutriloba macropyga TaxID=536237 RepID=UPI003F51D6D2
MTSSVGKKDSRLLSLICPEKQVNWNEIITCDLQTIKDFIDVVEACYLGYKFVQNNLIFIGVAGDIVVGDANENKRFEDLKEQMGNIFSEGADVIVTKTYTNLTLQPEIDNLMQEDLGNEPLWRAAWYAFRENNAPKIRPLLIEARDILNKWAEIAGYKDAPDAWVEQFEIGFEEYKIIIDNIVYRFEGLYQKIHAYVRHKMSKKFPDLIKEDGLIPVHLTKDIWGQVMDKHVDILQPYEDDKFDLGPKMKEMFGGNVTQIAEMAEKFYQSIGFPKLPASFYERSKFQESDYPGGLPPGCNGFAETFFVPPTDQRMYMCGRTDTRGLLTVYHEMGHVYYYLATNNQTYFFNEGANPSFHEAVGEVALLASTSMDNLINLGLLDPPTDRYKLTVNRLMSFALQIFPLSFFAYAVEMWMFDFFKGEKSDDAHLNEHWWYLVNKIQGLSTPDGEPRGEEYFDIAALKHISMVFPLYSQYMIGIALQYQFLKAICEGETYDHLSECNIADKPQATEKFREMLSKGKSVNWKTVLKKIMGRNLRQNPK